MKVLDIIARIFVFVGGLNWGLIGFFDFNLVNAIFSNMSLEKIIYDLVGISAIYLLCRCKKICGKCSDHKSCSS